jgi:superfamily II DNA or RNA helicase
MQTLGRWSWNEREAWGARFGLVILDEAHIAPAEGFAAVLGTMPGRYRLGLTATPTRMDGLGEWIFWSCGPEVYRIETGALEEAGCTLRPLVRWVRTGWHPPKEARGWGDIVTAATVDFERGLLVRSVVREQLGRGRICLVLSDRVDHCERLAGELCAEHGAGSASALVGRIARGERGRILDDARSGRLRVVVATSVADEGLDVPALDTVILTCPSRNLGRVQQRIGRALRPAPGKGRPEVIDFVDDFGAALGYANKRRGLYRSLGWA